MTRECLADFGKVREYINGYRISNNLNHKEYLDSLKKMHKYYFSCITWCAELNHKKDEVSELNNNINDDIVIRLSETVSDLGSALFNWTNGNYKTSRVMLRVAIENFIRAISSIEEKSQITEKSVYRVFEVASSQNIFNHPTNPSVKECYNKLKEIYKELCKDTHTATKLNMEQLTSLADLPTYQQEKSLKSSEVYSNSIKCINFIFCIVFNKFFHTMHHRNRENILNGISRDLKASIIAPNNSADD
ncbi:hypothetical protein [Shewanella algae]|uniref:hypothetical protein n=1 Tax=Shewanella algae TaxID=38313 RepID=UPI0031F5D6C8